MASLGHSKIELTLDSSAFNTALDRALEPLRKALDAAERREREKTQPLPMVVASAAAAAIGCARPVSRRSFFGLRLW